MSPIGAFGRWCVAGWERLYVKPLDHGDFRTPLGSLSGKGLPPGEAVGGEEGDPARVRPPRLTVRAREACAGAGGAVAADLVAPRKPFGGSCLGGCEGRGWSGTGISSTAIRLRATQASCA